jgi:hypothetical protein
MQFESWEDAVKKAKAKAVEQSLDIVPDSVPSTTRPAGSGSAWKSSAIALCVLAVFPLGFLASSFFAAGRGGVPAVDSGGIARSPVQNRMAAIIGAPRRDEPAYAVLGEEGDNAKEIFHVRLPRKVSVEGLRSLAYDVKARHGGKRPRTLIWFCLPGRRCPQSSWAFAEFDPDLKVELRGLTIQNEKILLAQPLPAHTELIGSWLDDALDAARYTIYRTSEGLFLSTMRLGSTDGLVQELVEKPAHEGERKFERKEGSRAGDRYLVGVDGNFEIRDDSGPILNGTRVYYEAR